MAPAQLPETNHVLLSIPEPYVLVVVMNRPQQMNALPVDACWEMDKVWGWFDSMADLRVAILTGAGDRSFSSGMDLKEGATAIARASRDKLQRYHAYPSSGFGGMTRRVGLKPIIAAVNGHAAGGGFELALNADLTIASSNAKFRLPDVMRGTAALQGAFPRLVRNVGMQRASLIALTGYEVSATEAVDWGLAIKAVNSAGSEGVVKEAIRMASLVASMSPDSVVVSRQGLREAWDEASVERAIQKTEKRWSEWLMGGENAMEGMKAFAERRPPRWKSRL